MTAKPNELLDEFASSSLSPSLIQPLIHRLLSHPAIHSGYLSLLALPTVQFALENNPQRDVIVRTLELFGYGTVDDYYRATDRYMKLNDVQLEKLKMLTVISVARARLARDGDVDMDKSTATSAAKKKKKKKSALLLSIPYAELSSKLHLPPNNVRQLEDILIQCIYANLLCGKLDQCSNCLVIQPDQSIVRDDDNEICGSILSRDLPPSSSSCVTDMISRLESFLDHSQSLLTTLEHGGRINTAIRTNDATRWKEVNRLLLSERNANAKFEEGEGMRREVKRSKMGVVQRFGGV